jgi:hypothetical protein
VNEETVRSLAVALLLFAFSVSCFAAKFCREEHHIPYYQIYSGTLVQKERRPKEKILPNPYWAVKFDEPIQKNNRKIEEIELGMTMLLKTLNSNRS